MTNSEIRNVSWEDKLTEEVLTEAPGDSKPGLFGKNTGANGFINKLKAAAEIRKEVTSKVRSIEKFYNFTYRIYKWNTYEDYVNKKPGQEAEQVFSGQGALIKAYEAVASFYEQLGKTTNKANGVMSVCIKVTNDDFGIKTVNNMPINSKAFRQSLQRAAENSNVSGCLEVLVAIWAGDKYDKAGLFNYLDQFKATINQAVKAAHSGVTFADKPVEEEKPVEEKPEEQSQVEEKPVEKTLESISYNQNKIKSIAKGTKITAAGLVFTLTYSDKSTEDIKVNKANVAEFVCDPNTSATPGDLEVTVTYKEKSCKIKVKIVEGFKLTITDKDGKKIIKTFSSEAERNAWRDAINKNTVKAESLRGEYNMKRLVEDFFDVPTCKDWEYGIVIEDDVIQFCGKDLDYARRQCNQGDARVCKVHFGKDFRCKAEDFWYEELEEVEDKNLAAIKRALAKKESLAEGLNSNFTEKDLDEDEDNYLFVGSKDYDGDRESFSNGEVIDCIEYYAYKHGGKYCLDVVIAGQDGGEEYDEEYEFDTFKELANFCKDELTEDLSDEEFLEEFGKALKEKHCREELTESSNQNIYYRVSTSTTPVLACIVKADSEQDAKEKAINYSNNMKEVNDYHAEYIEVRPFTGTEESDLTDSQLADLDKDGVIELDY